MSFGKKIRKCYQFFLLALRATRGRVRAEAPPSGPPLLRWLESESRVTRHTKRRVVVRRLLYPTRHPAQKRVMENAGVSHGAFLR